MDKNLLDKLLADAKIGGAQQAETFAVSSKTLRIDILDQKIESSDELKEMGLGLRVIKDQKMGFAFTSDLSDHSLDELVDQALHNSRHSVTDEYLQLPSPAQFIEAQVQTFYDPEITSLPLEQKIELAKKLESSAYAYDERVKKTEKVSYSDSEYEVWIANTRGVYAHYQANQCGGMAEVIAHDDQRQADSGMGLDFVARLKNFDPQKIGQEAGRSAVQLLGAKSLPSQRITIILEPRVGAELLGVLASSFSADNVQKGKSLFAGRLEQTIGSPRLTIIDDGTLRDGIATAPFDGEGTPTQETTLVESGVLKAFLYNTYTAAKDKTVSTGNAQRASFKSLPGISATNLFIKPGPHLAEAIVSGCKSGLYVTRVMGLHTANPITGDFSIGASGILIENGIKTRPIKGITLAGNLIEMLEHIEAVGSDLRFMPYAANLGSPTLLIEGLSVSGE